MQYVPLLFYPGFFTGYGFDFVLSPGPAVSLCVGPASSLYIVLDCTLPLACYLSLAFPALYTDNGLLLILDSRICLLNSEHWVLVHSVI